MPVLEACKIDGKMTAIPMSFSFPAVMFSQRLMEEVGIDLTGVKAVSSTQLLDWYDQARESKPDLNLFFTYNKTISKGVVLLILLSSKIGYTAGVATCSIIRSSTVDLYLYSYSKTVLR